MYSGHVFFLAFGEIYIAFYRQPNPVSSGWQVILYRYGCFRLLIDLEVEVEQQW